MKKKCSVLALVLFILPCVFLLSACFPFVNKLYNINFVVDEQVYSTVKSSGEEYIKLPNNPIKEGYTFVGWFFDKDTYRNQFTAGYYANTKLEKNVNVFAKFDRLVEVNSITLNSTNISVNVPNEYTLTATITPSNATNKNVSWVSSNPNIATVDSNGKVKALSVGTTVITATTSNNLTATCNVRVLPINNDVNVTVYIDNQKSEVLTTNKDNNYKIKAPTKPTDITKDPTINKYFYGWFIDKDCNTYLDENTQFKKDGSIYAKWIYVKEDCFNYTVGSLTNKATITSFNNKNNSEVVVVPKKLNNYYVETIGDNVFTNQTKIKKVVLLEGIKNINQNAFSKCSNLKEIELPDGLKTIGNNAFSHCSSLTKMIIPKTVIKMGKQSLDSCTSLTKLQVPFVGDDADCNTNSSFSYIFNGEKTVPNSLKEVKITGGEYIDIIAFRYCDSIETLILPNSLKDVYLGAFAGCSSLKYNMYEDAQYLGSEENPYMVLIKVLKKQSSFNFHPNTKIVYDDAFILASKLTNILIPNKVIALSGLCFENCKLLTTVIIDSYTISDLKDNNSSLFTHATTVYVKNDCIKGMPNDCYIKQNYTMESVSDKAGYTKFIKIV